MVTLGQQIRRLRIYRHMTQKALYRSAKISQRYLSVIEHDKADPTLSVLRKIAMALRVTVAELVDDTVEKDECQGLESSAASLTTS